MSGDPTPTVVFVGPEAERLVDAVARVNRFDMALVGGFAVMARIGSAHRATNDLDSVFDNPSDTPMVVQLIAAGVGRPVEAHRAQSVNVGGVVVDVIDSIPLPRDPNDLPEEAKDRLFLCAHRLAYDSATAMRLIAGEHQATLRVATPAALVAMKSHALRFASPQRRTQKRTSDLFDLYQLLVSAGPDRVADALAATTWDLDRQVRDALKSDVADTFQHAAATLRASSVAAIAAVNSTDFIEVITELLDQLPG